MRAGTLVIAQSSFAFADWLVLGGYFALLAVSGWWLSRRKQGDTRDYFLGGRSIPMWAVAISFLATAQSAATFLGAPEIAYRGNLTFLSVSIAQVIAALLVAFLFIPRFYRHNVTTVYGLLETKLGRTSKQAASGMFMVGRVFASGARLYMAALAAAMILFGDIQAGQVAVAIGVMVFIGIAYTLVGGVRSVIFTDVIQACVYVGAAIAAIVVLWRLLPFESVGEAVTSLAKPQAAGELSGGGAAEASKLTVVDTSFGGFGKGFTIWTVLTGWTLLNLAAFATDQDLAQRTLTCRNARSAGRSVVVAMVVGAPVTLLFLLVGTLLYAYYTHKVSTGAAAGLPGDDRKVFLTFIMSDMPVGLAGLMIAGLIAAGLSSFNSALHAMASAFVDDIYRAVRPGRDERHYLNVGRSAVVGWGLVLGAFAIVCIAWQQSEGASLIAFALGVMMFAYSGLLAVFLTAMFTRRGNTVSVIAALVTGFVVVLLFQKAVWVRVTPDTWHAHVPAGPWQMVVATAAAFGVCCLGRRSTSVASANDMACKVYSSPPVLPRGESTDGEAVAGVCASSESR